MSDRVWVVDDNDMILKMVFDILTKNGYQVKCFNHPAVVINRLMNIHEKHEMLPQVMLVDYFMPDLNGTELIDTIRSMGKEYHNISFVGITSRDEPEADAEFTKRGVLLLRKPDFREADMLIRVMRAQVERTQTGTWPIVTPDEIRAKKKPAG